MKRHASMNRVYRLVWSQVQNAWVAVAETARGRGMNSSRKLIAATLSLFAALFSHQGLAAPSGGQVVSGAGSIAQSGTTTNISQSNANLSLNWQSFNVAPKETVKFLQPSAAAIAVNRILDSNGSQILGHLNANGQVYLINPNGVLFGAGAQVNSSWDRKKVSSLIIRRIPSRVLQSGELCPSQWISGCWASS